MAQRVGRTAVATRTSPSRETVTKRELCERIAKQTQQTQVLTKQIVQLFLDQIIEELSKGRRLELRNFGVFDVRYQPPRKAHNPRKTDEVVQEQAKVVVSFKAGKEMGDEVQKALPKLQEERQQQQ
jgi:integration host factor subunit beta